MRAEVDLRGVSCFGWCAFDLCLVPGFLLLLAGSAILKTLLVFTPERVCQLSQQLLVSLCILEWQLWQEVELSLRGLLGTVLVNRRCLCSLAA